MDDETRKACMAVIAQYTEGAITGEELLNGILRKLIEARYMLENVD